MTKDKRGDYFVAPPESVVVLEDPDGPPPWEAFPDDRTDEQKALAERTAQQAREAIEDTGESEQ